MRGPVLGLLKGGNGGQPGMPFLVGPVGCYFGASWDQDTGKFSFFVTGTLENLGKLFTQSLLPVAVESELFSSSQEPKGQRRQGTGSILERSKAPLS